jgi:predicted AlkP superfamily pyrophosphatase or phosphodiesterase
MKMFRTRHMVTLVVMSLFCAAGMQSAEAAERTAPRVIIISCDGLRPDAIDRGGLRNLQSLISQGSFHPRAKNEDPPVTLPNHVSMVTGLSVSNHDVRGNRTKSGRVGHRTIFDVASENGKTVAFFVSKPKLEYLCDPRSAASYYYDSNPQYLTNEVIRAIREIDPQLTFIHYADPDETGHKKGWMSSRYLEAARRVDVQIGRIIQTLRDEGLLEHTTIMVTSDHGGHWTGHYLNVSVNRRVPFIISGPGVESNRRLDRDVDLVDVPATALAILDLPGHSARDGRTITEAFSHGIPSQQAAARDRNRFRESSLIAIGPGAVLATVLALIYTRRRARRAADQS